MITVTNNQDSIVSDLLKVNDEESFHKLYKNIAVSICGTILTPQMLSSIVFKALDFFCTEAEPNLFSLFHKMAQSTLRSGRCSLRCCC